MNQRLTRGYKIASYSLVPKERHVRKEGYGCTLGLCIGCNERDDSTFGQSIDPKERHAQVSKRFVEV